MGDHRVGVKIEFSAHGKVYKTEWNINWSPDDFPRGCDRRVTEWFEESFMDAYGRYQEGIYETDRERREAEERKLELAELARLKAKYGEPEGP